MQRSRTGEVFNPQTDFLFEHMEKVGFPRGETYYTYLVKYALKRGEKPKASMWKECSLFLEDEIVQTDPDLIICLGALPFENMYGAQGYFDITRGEVMTRRICGKDRRLLGVFNLDQVEKHPEFDDAFDRDLREGANFLNGTPRKVPEVDTMTFTHPEELAAFRDGIFKIHQSLTLFVDSEWGGKNWQDPARYFRTVQFCYDRNKAVVLHLTRAGGERVGDYDGMLAELKKLFEDPRVGIVGHNIIADGEWLLSFGIDIRPRIVYDTMLAEHILKNIGPFGLDDLSMKYTDFGRYCVDSDVWAKEHKSDVEKNGYGNMPDDILLPYGAYDVCVLDHILEKQVPLLEARGALEPRGVHKEYPSLLHTVMATQRSLFEMEITGLPFDVDRFKELVDAYQGIRAEAYGELTTACANLGMPDINVNSSPDLRKLLFDKCGLTPIKATNKKAWSDAMSTMAMDDDSGSVVASTDKDSLTMLEHAHPIVGLLLKYRRVSKPCDLFRMPDEDGEGGLMSYVWPDGRIHTRYSQLLATGRLSSSNPNCFPGYVEVLTEDGWMSWKDLFDRRAAGNVVRLAQWDTKSLMKTYEKPTAYVLKHDQDVFKYVFSGTIISYNDTFKCMVPVSGICQKSVSITCTQDHGFYVYKTSDLESPARVEIRDLYDLMHNRNRSGNLPDKLCIPYELPRSKDVGHPVFLMLEYVDRLYINKPFARTDVYCVAMPAGTVIVREPTDPVLKALKGEDGEHKEMYTGQCQNFSKKADAAMAEVFAPDPPPPSMRSFVKPPDGWVMMETDYSTAELHVLGNLSGDPNLLKALHTLGTDMHTMVAIDSFHLHMFDETGKEWTQDDICKFAADLGSDECDEFVTFQKHLTYKNENGLCLTHAQMKNGPRLAAKTTNFSIMYGIGAASLALRIKSTTKDPRPLAVITAEMQRVLDAWKTKSFPVAWNTLEGWKRLVYEQGYIDNAWGMRKWTPVRPGDKNAGYEREAANFCIQSLVSGTIQIATERLLDKRSELGLHFKLQNQIHDALMLEVPVDEIDITKKTMHWAMSEIDIPIYDTGKTFRLGSDTDLYSRWGEKLK